MRGRKPRIGAIFTLDPNKFVERKQKFLRIGSLRRFTPYVSLLRESRHVKAHSLEYASVPVGRPFPPNTNAFLYYSVAQDKPRIAGELRLRVVTPSKGGASFERGSDLLHPCGRPWARPLYTLSKRFFPLYEKLREEDIIPDDLDKALSTLPSRDIRYQKSQVLYTFNDTFIVNFAMQTRLLIITEQGVENIYLNKMFHDARKSINALPYTGAHTSPSLDNSYNDS